MKILQNGELEMQLMDILWDSKDATVNAIHKRISKNRPIAYTTVATILQRLYDKKLLNRYEDHNHYVYSPAISRKDYSSNLVKNFINKLLSNFGDLAISSFAENLEALPKDKKEYLISLLQENENK